jgi:hypothetical protein
MPDEKYARLNVDWSEGGQYTIYRVHGRLHMTVVPKNLPEWTEDDEEWCNEQIEEYERQQNIDRIDGNDGRDIPFDP